MDIMDDGQADRMDIMDGMGRDKTMDRQQRAATAALAAMDRDKKND